MRAWALVEAVVVVVVAGHGSEVRTLMAGGPGLRAGLAVLGFFFPTLSRVGDGRGVQHQLSLKEREKSLLNNILVVFLKDR